MLPDSLTGSYKRYKEDTNVFATWLSRTAPSCGYKTPKPLPTPPMATNGPSARLKGKARKEAKAALAATQTADKVETTSHVVSTKDLLIQAEAIAKWKPRQIMPETVYRVVRRAISARRRFLAWFKQTRPEDVSNASHEHFIGVLENALELLKPCVTKHRDTATEEKMKSGDKKPSKDNPPITDETLHNRFSALNVEDVDEDLLDITSADIIDTKSKTPSNKAKVVDIYEVQMEAHMDIAFRLYCFFEDLHRIQEFLKDTWRSYAAGELELMAASLTSNVAFELVRRAEEEMTSNFPASFQHDKSYMSLASVLLDLQPGSTLYGDFVYNFTYSVMSMFLMTYNQSYELSPIMSGGLQYVLNPTRKQAPSVEEMADFRILTQYLQEVKFRHLIGRGDRTLVKGRASDVLSEALQSVVDTGKATEIKVWLVFGVSVLLDIWKILGPKSNLGYAELLRRGGKAKAILGLNTSPISLKQEWQGCGGKSHMGCAWNSLECIELGRACCIRAQWNIECPESANSRVISPREAANMVKGYLTANDSASGRQLSPIMNKEELLPAMKYSQYLRKAWESYDSSTNSCPIIDIMTASVDDIEAYNVEKKIHIEMIWLSQDPAFFDNHNLIYCGMEAIQLTMNMEGAGIGMIHESRYFIGICHLVNASRQLKLLDEPWKALDTLMSLHINRLFAGALPTGAKDMLSRLRAVMGYSPSSFARDARGTPKFTTKYLARISHTETSKMLHRYNTMDEKIEATLVEAEAEYLRASRNHRSEERGRTKNSKRLSTPIEILTRLRDSSQRDIEDMDFDYISLSRLCTQLGDRITARIKSELDIDYRSMQMLIMKEPVFTAMVDDILEEVGDWNFHKENKKRFKEPPAEKPAQLGIAAKVIQEFIREIGANDVPPPYQPFPIPSFDLPRYAEWRSRNPERFKR